MSVLYVGCGRKDHSDRTQTTTDAWFQDVTTKAGIRFQHERGPTRYWLPEIMSGGAAWFDFDRDNDADLYLVQGGDLAREGSGPASVLYRNRGNGTFEDVTEQAGVGQSAYGMGATVGDYDGDGDLDLYVTCVGANRLYRNRGDGTFDDVTQHAGVGDPGWGTSAAFVDYDQDGDQDLFVVNYIRWSPDVEIDCRTSGNLQDYCSPKVYQAPAMDVMYRNRGDGTFEDATRELGFSTAYGNGLGVTVGDFNRDGRLDLYVANDGTPNQLWLQDEYGKFQDWALRMGCSVNRMGAAQAGMGVSTVDIENDGDLDLFVTNLANETNSLYINQGAYFDDKAAAAGLAAPSLIYTGFGTGFCDFDHDQHLDLYIANGRVGRNRAALIENDHFAEPNQLFRGLGNGRFQEVWPQGGTDPVLIENSRAAAFADYDLDGDVDVLVVNNGGRTTLLSNQAGARGGWIRLRVLDASGQDAIGALIQIESKGRKQWRVVSRTYSYQSCSEPIVHFGLGSETRIDSVQIEWPGGSQETFGSFEGRQVIELRKSGTRNPPSSSGRTSSPILDNKNR